MSYDKQNGSNTYRDQQILTASPARLVAMLYEAAITSLRRAIKAIEDGDIRARWAANSRAVDIIEHLSMTLDTEQGGQIASDLERLYPFMIRHLIDVDVHNDPAPAREVIALLEPLYESWRTLERRMVQGAETPATETSLGETPLGETLPGGRITATA